MTADLATNNTDDEAPAASSFSIDDEDEEEAVAVAAANDAGGDLEGNYNSDEEDDDDDDIDVHEEDEGHAESVKLASRTNMLMQNFNQYLTDITGNNSEGDSGQADQLDQEQQQSSSKKVSWNGDSSSNNKINGSSGGSNKGKKNGIKPTLYRDFIDIEENNAYDDIEQELNMQGRYNKRNARYTHPILHSKRFQRGLCTIVIAAVVVGVSVGITNSKKNRHLPDWNQQLKDQIIKEGFTGDGLPGAKPQSQEWKPGDPLPPSGSGSSMGGEMSYEDQYNTNYPNSIPEFHTTTASGGGVGSNSHTSGGSGPYNHNVNVLNNKPHSDNAHGILDGVTHHDDSSSIVSSSSSSSQSVWFDRSTWTGMTYQEAAVFCASKNPLMEICPYEAYCPQGPRTQPVGGSKNEEAFGSWAPVKDGLNSWVQVGPNDPCVLYSSSFGHTPDWGLSGGNEQQTRHMMCCEVDDTAENSAVDRNPNLSPGSSSSGGSNESQKPYSDTEQTNLSSSVVAEEYQAAQEWNPTWYTRKQGWLGQNYEEASQFCKSKGDNSDLCQYSVICPTGPNHLPYGGMVEEPNGAWAPLKDSENGWVQVGDQNVCIRYMTLYLESPSWGMTGEDNEEITRHIPCCTSPKTPSDNPTTEIYEATSSANIAAPGVADAIAKVEAKYKPVEYDRDSGWKGTSYTDAIVFCASQESRIPCPYEAYCPMGELAAPYGGISENPNGAWAPMMDAPNSWVQIGDVGTCQKYNDIHPHPPKWGLTGENSESFTTSLLCCEDPYEAESSPVKTFAPLTSKEGAVLNHMHPVWFDRGDGYSGTTHEEADLFCNSIVGMSLCPVEAYCPNGPVSDKPLYLQKDSFQGEQWAPFSPYAGTIGVSSDLDNGYVMIGTLDGNPSSTCLSYDSLHTNQLPPWAVDGSMTELKQHVMCCDDSELSKAQEQSIQKSLSPIWLDAKHGWGGGSHSDAEKFCDELGGMKLCPYAAYCPHSTGRQPLGGHAIDFNTQGVQYAPVFEGDNAWVMIGQKGGNAATTCMLHKQLEGHDPEWGLNDERHEIKNHILCCKF